MTRARTQHAIDQSIADDYAPDSEGNQRWRIAEEVAAEYATLPAERRAQLERDWHNPNFRGDA